MSCKSVNLQVNSVTRSYNERLLLNFQVKHWANAHNSLSDQSTQIRSLSDFTQLWTNYTNLTKPRKIDQNNNGHGSVFLIMILLKICQSFKFSYFVLVVFVNVQKNNLERIFSTKVTQVNVCLSSKWGHLKYLT